MWGATAEVIRRAMIPTPDKNVYNLMRRLSKLSRRVASGHIHPENQHRIVYLMI
jgi:hypothetical protein